jgi:hypothetical protein
MLKVPPAASTERFSGCAVMVVVVGGAELSSSPPQAANILPQAKRSSEYINIFFI